MQLVQAFSGVSSLVEVSNTKTGMSGYRLQSASEFKKEKGLKGNVAKKAYNTYLRDQGLKANAAFAASIAKGEIAITGAKAYEKSGKGNITFIRTDSIIDPVEKAAKAAEQSAKDTMAKAAVNLSKKSGCTVEEALATLMGE